MHMFAYLGRRSTEPWTGKEGQVMQGVEEGTLQGPGRRTGAIKEEDKSSTTTNSFKGKAKDHAYDEHTARR